MKTWKLSSAALDRAIFAALLEQDKLYDAHSAENYQWALDHGYDKTVDEVRRVWRVGFDALMKEYLR
jgi:hypothetical protein